MPLVKINMLKGKNLEYKRTVFDCVHQGLVEGFGIQNWDRFQRIDEYDKENFEIPEDKTDNFMIIELTVFPDRSKVQKASVIKTITEVLVEKLSISATDVFITFIEPPLENWGMGGNQKG